MPVMQFAEFKIEKPPKSFYYVMWNLLSNDPKYLMREKDLYRHMRKIVNVLRHDEKGLLEFMQYIAFILGKESLNGGKKT